MTAELPNTAKRKRRWYQFTPAHLLLSLFIVEGFLSSSERFRWFAFNEHKGWTALIALAGAGVTLTVLLVWFLTALACRRAFQFRLWSLFLLVLAIAIPCNWVSASSKRARRQRETAEAIRKDGGQVLYDYQLAVPPGTILNFLELPGPAWLRRLLGDDYFTDVLDVMVSNETGLEELDVFDRLRSLNLCRLAQARAQDGRTGVTLADCGINDDDLKHLSGMGELRSLNIMSPNVTDAGLEHLKGLIRLQGLNLSGTKTTDAGVFNLQKALPNCQIIH